MKLNKIIILSMFFITVIATAATGEVADKIIAVVNDDIITLREFEAAAEPYLKGIEEKYKNRDEREAAIRQTKSIILQRLIDNILIQHEAKKIGAVIKEEEVMNVLKDMLARQNMKMDAFVKKLEQEGTSLAFVKNEIKEQLMRIRLMRWEIKAKIVISEQEIGDYYNKHRNDYEGKEAVRIKQILLLIPANAGMMTKNQIRENISQIRKRAVSGESFDMLAAKYSQGPAADQGGDVGFIERGIMIPEVETAAFSLPLNQISDVIESEVGFHIIKVVDKRGAGLKPMEEVREEIKSKLEDEKLEKKYEEWITAVRKKSHIEIRN